ncbi:MAG: response regulator [candidate division KSB1 bacterium]|nr:response regulator [candidate division KSB1 bacterium]MDZ7336564.1 response regulator [candidate division KSB1 bacterium]MDZ7357766.1 response regulator [candidate division KSB1 bacterium]MDZ7375331.1 response regulator [candidate division KSB1 bacterium]MDZ7400247.1 response regulator [candidate division KSB1 bacterium]
MPILRTLVVDDELGMRLSIQRALSRHRLNLPDVDEAIAFEVELAETGEQAVEKIEANQPDILLLDYKLPGMSGLEVLEKVSSLANEMMIIMITAYASIETAVTAVKRGAFDFIAKPFTPAELKKTVNKAAQSLIIARQLRKLAQEKHQVRFQFISVLAHELKSPLNSIDGYLDILNKKTLGNDLNAYQSMIERCMVRIEGMRKLIHDLLDLTRLESGQKQRELKQIDIRELAQKAIETLQPEANQRNVSLTLHADSPIMMTADAGEIEIILNNLLSNGIKYNKPGGKVDIVLHQDNGAVQIAVKDTGIGMTEEETLRLFNEFVRIKNEKTKNILGSGLGLAIVKKITQLYHGDISVKSKPDVGSTFSVTLRAD